MFDKVEAFYRPDNVREALRLLRRGNGQARVVAGGTDVVVEGDRTVRFLIDITRAGLTYIRRRGKTCVIGATTTMTALEESPAIQSLAGGLLARAAATCGSVQIRNMATLGGNMANGSPAADLAAPLLALGAAAVVADLRGRHRMSLASYLEAVHAGELSRALLVEIVVPEPPGARRSGWSFQKFGRTAVDISLVSVAAGLQADLAGRVKWARIALGAVAPSPLRMSAAEERMAGHALDETLLAIVSEEVARDIQPITDTRASADYRRELSRVLTRRALEECANQTGCFL